MLYRMGVSRGVQVFKYSRKSAVVGSFWIIMRSRFRVKFCVQSTIFLEIS